MTYLEWNNLIAGKYFNAAGEGQRVFLSVNTGELEQLGGLRDFIEAAKTGPPWVQGINDICTKAHVCSLGWRGRDLPFPPYLGFLALFAAAAALDGEFSPNAYYPRLRKLLGEPVVAGTYRGFELMRTLWRDLEVWSQEDQQGRLGSFEATTHSRFVHVGFPISQVILNEHERKMLPLVFADVGLEPGATPSEQYLRHQILTTGLSYLRARTIAVLEDPTRLDEQELILSVIGQELRSWDGALRVVGPESVSHVSTGALRICIDHLDDIAGSATVRLRLRTKRDIPLEGLQLRLPNGDVMSCESFSEEWSMPLIDSKSGSYIDASVFDWAQPLAAIDPILKWKTRLTALSARPLVSAAPYGFAGHVETDRLPEMRPFLVLAQRRHSALLKAWGASSCDGFKEIQVNTGLPSDWILFEADTAHSDSLVREIFPALTFPRTLQISFAGGIRERGNSYYFFAPPCIQVAGLCENGEVTCNDLPMNANSDGFFVIPDVLVKPGSLQVRIVTATATWERSIWLVEGAERSFDREHIIWLDELALPAEPGVRNVASGAEVRSDVALQTFSGWLDVQPDLRRDEVASDNLAVSESTEREGSLLGEDSIDEEEWVRAAIAEWRAEVCSRGGTVEYVSLLSRLPQGRALTEGAIQYAEARASGSQRHFGRAIRELQDAARSSHWLVCAVATAMLQLAYFRSERKSKAAQVDIPELPPYMAQVNLFMQSFRGEVSPLATLSDSSLAVSDISPLPEKDFEIPKIHQSEPDHK